MSLCAFNIRRAAAKSDLPEDDISKEWITVIYYWDEVLKSNVEKKAVWVLSIWKRGSYAYVSTLELPSLSLKPYYQTTGYT